MLTEIQPSQLAAELLTAGKTVRLCAEGGSMRPWLKPGTAVTLEPIECSEKIRIGDVVFTIADGRPMLHRVVRVSPILITKGDALGCFDPPPQAVLGRAVGLSSPVIALLSRTFQPFQRLLLLLGIIIWCTYDR